MSSVYVADYAEQLRKVGKDDFLRLYPRPVLIVAGLAGTLKEQERSKTGTQVSEVSDILRMGTIVGRVFHVEKAKGSPPGPVLIGRVSDNDIAIPEYSISKRHCFLAVVANEIRMTDCGSTNGTLINGFPLEPKKPYRLYGGETITLGRFLMLFHQPEGFIEYLRTVK